MVALSGLWRSVLHGIMADRMKFRAHAEALMFQMANNSDHDFVRILFSLFIAGAVVASVPFLCTTEHIQYPTIGITYKFIEPVFNAKVNIK